MLRWSNWTEGICVNTLSGPPSKHHYNSVSLWVFPGGGGGGGADPCPSSGSALLVSHLWRSVDLENHKQYVTLRRYIWVNFLRGIGFVSCVLGVCTCHSYVWVLIGNVYIYSQIIVIHMKNRSNVEWRKNVGPKVKKFFSCS